MSHRASDSNGSDHGPAEPFVSRDTLCRLDTLTREDADRIPFGIVRLDDDGIVLLYNRWESDMSGLSAERTVGRNFFSEIAPCTNNRLFFGRFAEGVARGALDVELDYTLTYKMRPTSVSIRLYRAPKSGTNWVFITNKRA